MAVLEAGQFRATFQLVTVAARLAGAGGGATFTQPGAVTLSNVAVHKLELLWLVSAKPIYAVDSHAERL